MPPDITVLDLSAYVGLTAVGAITLNMLLGTLMIFRYSPVRQWPHRRFNYFRLHNFWEARAQADNTRDRSVQGRFALYQDRLAIPGNLEDVKSGFHRFQTAWNQTIAQGDSLDGRHTALRRVAVRALEKGRQVPVFG